MTTSCELAGRARIRAFRDYQHAPSHAEGELSAPGSHLAVDLYPRRIFRPPFDLLRFPRDGSVPGGVM